MLNLAQTAYGVKPPSRDELIETHIENVRRIAFRMAKRLPPHVDVGDLIGAGMEGLVKAADAFDPTQYTEFKPYAEARIRGAILDELRVHDPMTRHGRKRLAQVTKAIHELERELGRLPEEEEIAERLEITLGQYQKLMEDFSRVPALSNLGRSEPDDVLSPFFDPAAVFEEKEIFTFLMKAIGELPKRMQQVLALYYQEECTQAEIGMILEITESRVCQVLGEASARLRAKLVSHKVVEPRKNSTEAKNQPSSDRSHLKKRSSK